MNIRKFTCTCVLLLCSNDLRHLIVQSFYVNEELYMFTYRQVYISYCDTSVKCYMNDL